MTEVAENLFTPTITTEPTPKPTRKDAWIKSKRHTITLPSSMVVEIELPNLPQLIKSGKVPNELLDAAIGAGPDTEITREMMEQQADFYAYLVSVTVIEPQITADDVSDLPFEDVEMIAAFAMRQRDMDAVYKHMSGLEKVASFRKFRRLDRGDALSGDV